MKAERLTPVVTHHGEGPVWSPRWAGPRFVDMLAGDVCELQPDGGIDRSHVGTVAAVIRPRVGQGSVIAREHDVALTETDDIHSPCTSFARVLSDPGIRLNEGGCGPDGTFYIGSMAYDMRDGAASLYRIAPDGGVETVIASVTISNGLGFSPGGGTMFYVDSPTNQVRAFTRGEDSQVVNGRVFATVERPLPDGLTVDGEGGVWVAMFGAGEVRMFDPDGKLSQVVEVPTPNPTAVTFFGTHLEKLLITTSAEGLGTPDGLAGSLFTLEPGVTGLPCLEAGL